MTCKACKFWLRGGYINYRVEDQGQCRRFPPMINLEKIDAEGFIGRDFDFPWVNENKWCGEYRQIIEGDHQ